MNQLVILAVLGVAVALLAGHRGRGSLADRRRLAGTETLPISAVLDLHRSAAAAAGAGFFHDVVEVRGVVRPGSGGPLTAPLSGRPCVWHRHTVRRREQRNRGRGGTTTSTESTLASTAAFVVDDGTGSVHVVPAALVEGATQVVSEFVEAPAGTRTLGYQRDEWILEEGVTVFVHAIAEDASGELRLSSPGRSGDMVISTRSEAEELNRLERLGLTFGRVQRGAVAFTIVCVLAIVALVVLT